MKTLYISIEWGEIENLIKEPVKATGADKFFISHSNVKLLPKEKQSLIIWFVPAHIGASEALLLIKSYWGLEKRVLLRGYCWELD